MSKIYTCCMMCDAEYMAQYDLQRGLHSSVVLLPNPPPSYAITCMHRLANFQ